MSSYVEVTHPWPSLPANTHPPVELPQISGGPILANALRLNLANVPGLTVPAGGTFTYDIEVANSDWLTVLGSMTGTAAGDLTFTVQPYTGGNDTLMAISIPPLTTPPTTTVQGGKVSAMSQYDVRGIGRVRVTWRNSSASAQQLDASWRLENWT